MPNSVRAVNVGGSHSLTAAAVVLGKLLLSLMVVSVVGDLIGAILPLGAVGTGIGFVASVVLVGY